MAIAYGTITAEQDSAGSIGSFSFSHNNSGANVLLVLVTVSGPAADVAITSPDFGGDALVEEAYVNRALANSPHAWLFSLASPGSGSLTVSGTFDTNVNSLRILAVPVTDADTANIIGAIETGIDVAAAISDSITTDTANSDANLWAVWRDQQNAPPVTPGASMTELDEGDTGGTSATQDNVASLNKRSVTTATAYTVAATASSSERNVWIAFEVHIAAAVGGRIMSSLAGSGGLAHKGGIAGAGGGLAG